VTNRTTTAETASFDTIPRKPVEEGDRE